MSEQDNVRLAGKPGTYEAWFLTFTDPGTGQGFWIRSTLLSPKRGPVKAGIWLARFDRADPGATLGLHAASPLWSASQDAFLVEIGTRSSPQHALMRSGHASGTLEGGGHSASWSLTYETGSPTYRLLPGGLYRGVLVPTRPYSPNVDTVLSGSIDIDGATVVVDEVRGQQGHVAGSRQPERWAWAHCSDFLDEEEAVLHATTAQGRRGPFTTPHLTFAGVLWQGRWIRFSKLSRRRDFGLGNWRVSLENRRYRLTGRVEAATRALLRARYDDPDGEPRFCHNSEISSCRLALFERRAGGFEEVALLESRGTTHAEWGGRTAATRVEHEFVEIGGTDPA